MPTQQALPFFQAPKEALKLLDGDSLVWDRIMRRMKVPLGEQTKMLGQGGHGIAIQVGSDRVLKITDDPVEASAALILQKSPMPEAYHVDDVFSVPLKTDLIHTPTGKRYCIVTELLDWPDREYVIAVTYWAMWSRGYEPLTPENIDILLKGYAQDIDPEVAKWFRSAAANLVKRKILYRDLKSNNLMKRPNGEHVMIDFGHMSDVPSKRIPTAELLEAVAQRLISA